MRWIAKTRELLRRFGGENSGQAMVEFALVAGLLMILIVGVFEFSRALNAQQALTLAAREGARRAVVADPDITQGQIDTVIKAALDVPGLDPDSAVITYPCWDPATGSETGGYCFRTASGDVQVVRVAVPYRFDFLQPLIAAANGGTGYIVMETVVRFRIE